MLREQKGITLVALVITIIVLLILAGVSISLVVGNNGVLTRASGAVVTNIATGIAEDIQLAFGTAEMEYQYAAAGRPGASRSPYYETENGLIAQELDKGTMTVVTKFEDFGATEETSSLFDEKGNPTLIDDHLEYDSTGKAITFGSESGEQTVPATFTDGMSYVVSYREDGMTETYYFLLKVNGGATAEFIGYVPDEMAESANPDDAPVGGEEDPT